MHASPDRCLSTGMGRSPPNPGSLFSVLRYPSRQRESKCVLAQGALSLYTYLYLVLTPVVPSTGYLSTGSIWEKPIPSFDIGKSCQRQIWVPSTNQPTPHACHYQASCAHGAPLLGRVWAPGVAAALYIITRRNGL
jgi:hypothetical protein